MINVLVYSHDIYFHLGITHLMRDLGSQWSVDETPLGQQNGLITRFSVPWDDDVNLMIRDYRGGRLFEWRAEKRLSDNVDLEIAFISSQKNIETSFFHPGCSKHRLYIDITTSIKRTALLIRNFLRQQKLVRKADCRCKDRKYMFTKREIDIMSCYQLGFNNNQISRLLNINVKTISHHKRSAMRKLGVSGNAVFYRWLSHIEIIA